MRRRILSSGAAVCGLVLAVTLPLLAANGVAGAGAAPRPYRVLVLGDSYSAGNGAGSYLPYGPADCYRSSKNYAQRFADLLSAAPSPQATTVVNAACSGATTKDFTTAQDNSVPPQLTAVDHSFDTIMLTIGGNDLNFRDLVEFCLIALTRDADKCKPVLDNAQQLINNGTVKNVLTTILQQIHRRDKTAKVVLLGYPFLEGDTAYALQSATGAILKVGQLLRQLQVSGNNVQAKVVAGLNAGYPGSPFGFVDVQPLFSGPPFRGLYADRFNPDRWMVQPGQDVSLLACDTCYHPNVTGWDQEARLLARSSVAVVPRTPRAAITSSRLPAATTGAPYRAKLTTADHRPGTWSVVDSTLPPGLAISGSTISGTPTKAGSYRFIQRFVDQSGRTAQAFAFIHVNGRS